MVFTEYEKRCMVLLHNKGHKAPTIAKLLVEDGVTASRRGVHKFLKRYEERRTTARRPGSGRPSKISDEIRSLVEAKMRDRLTGSVALKGLQYGSQTHLESNRSKT